MLLNYLEQSYQLGPLTIHVYGLALAVAIITGLYVAIHNASQKKLSRIKSGNCQFIALSGL